MDFMKAYLVPNPVGPSSAIFFDPDVCDGCNKCIDFCRADVLMPNPVPGNPPIVAYPDECWFGGCCAGACPNADKGAIRMDHPMPMRATWKRKETGEFFRVGIKDHPEAVTRPPVVE